VALARSRICAEPCLPIQKEELFSITVGANRDQALSFVQDYRKCAGGTSTGFSVWYGCQVLLNHMERRVSGQKGVRVLELGAGCGLLGMGLAKLGAQVVMTDVPEVCTLLKCHVAMNFSSAERTPAVEILRWGQNSDIQKIQSEMGEGFDYILGSEIVYDPEANQALMDTVQAFAGLANTRVLFCMARREGEVENFERCVKTAHWVMEEIEETDMEALTGCASLSPVFVAELRPSRIKRLSGTSGEARVGSGQSLRVRFHRKRQRFTSGSGRGQKEMPQAKRMASESSDKLRS